MANGDNQESGEQATVEDVATGAVDDVARGCLGSVISFFLFATFVSVFVFFLINS